MSLYELIEFLKTVTEDTLYCLQTYDGEQRFLNVTMDMYLRALKNSVMEFPENVKKLMTLIITSGLSTPGAIAQLASVEIQRRAAEAEEEQEHASDYFDWNKLKIENRPQMLIKDWDTYGFKHLQNSMDFRWAYIFGEPMYAWSKPDRPNRKSGEAHPGFLRSIWEPRDGRVQRRMVKRCIFAICPNPQDTYFEIIVALFQLIDDRYLVLVHVEEYNETKFIVKDTLDEAIASVPDFAIKAFGNLRWITLLLAYENPRRRSNRRKM